MVLMHGTNRVFEKPNPETSSSSSVRTVSIYGVTSYNDVVNCIIPILSKAGGYSGTNTININNLGAVNLKTFKSGNKVGLDDNWIGINEVYYIYYDGTDFIVFKGNSNSSSQTQNTYIVGVDLSSLVAGTYTQAQIENIIDSNFFDIIGNYGIILNDSNTNKMYEVLNTSISYDTVLDTATFKFTILDDSNNLITYTVVFDSNLIEYTVSISTIDLSLRNANNIQY